MLLDLRELGLDGFGVDLDQEAHVIGADLAALGVDLSLRRDAADGRVDGLALALDAAEDPLEHPDVVAEPGPDEVPLVVLAEPVDEEDLRELRPLALRDLQ